MTKILLDIFNEWVLDNDTCSVTIEIINFFSGTLSYRRDGKSINNTVRVEKVLKVGVKILNEGKGLYTNDSHSNLEVDKCIVHDLTQSILYFIDELIRQHRHYKTLITAMMSDIVRLLLFYIQLSDNEVKRYQSNPDDLVLNDLVPTSVRYTCSETTAYMCNSEELRKSFQDSLFPLIDAQLETAQKLNDEVNSWKLREACYHVIFYNKNNMVGYLDKTDGCSEIFKFLSSVVVADMSSDMWFLAVRAGIVFNIFCRLLPGDELVQLIDLMLAGVKPDGEDLLRTFNIRALKMLYEDYDDDDDDDETQFNVILRSRLAAVFESCLHTLQSIKGTTIIDVSLHLIALLITNDPQICSANEMKLMEGLLHVSTGDFRDDGFTVYCLQVFSTTLPVGLCAEAIKETWLPYVVRVLNNPATAEREDLQLAFDVLSCFLRHAEDPLKRLLVDECFEAVIVCAETSPDARNCLCEFLRYASHHLNSLKNGYKTTHRELIYELIYNWFTNRKSSSDICSFKLICRLTSMFLTKFRSAMEESFVYILIQVLLTRLNSLQAASPEAAAAASIFAHLINNDSAWTIDHLRSVTDHSVDERTAFQEVLVSILMSIKYYTRRNEIVSLYSAVGCVLKYAVKPENQEYFSTLFANLGDSDENVIWYLFKLVLCKLKEQYEVKGRKKIKIGDEEKDDKEFNDLSDDNDASVVFNEKLVNIELTKLLENLTQNMVSKCFFKNYQTSLNSTEQKTLLKVLSKHFEKNKERLPAAFKIF